MSKIGPQNFKVTKYEKSPNFKSSKERNNVKTFILIIKSRKITKSQEFKGEK